MKRPVRQLMTIICLLLAGALLGAQAGAQEASRVRVYLRRLQVKDSLHITVQGSYMLEGGSMAFQDGTDMVIALREDQLVLHVGGASIALGASCTLLRCQSETPGALLLQGESGLYEGDLSLTIADGVIRPVLSIDVEDYLLGVVPFEMGDSFPLEALKAQAVAARTYALRKCGSEGDYDVEDTTNDQAYRGRTAYSPLSEQAVRETEGLCGVYKGRLAQCFYSASNGGQTELGEHVWPTSEPDAYGYMDMRDDPYDLENDASVVKRYTIDKKPGEKGVGTALHASLAQALAPQLEAAGVQPRADCIRIDEVLALEAITPKFDGESRLMTELRFTLRLSAREAIALEAPTASPAAAAAEASTPSPDAPTPTSAPTAAPVYTDYRALESEFTVTLPIFTTAEQAMGLSINISRNELITVCDIGSSFMVESRRYGHCVGMSQRGAQQMAGEHAKTYQEILAFYYPGMELVTASAQSQPLPTIDAELMATPAPTPSPTPRPTLMPVAQESIGKGEYLAVVSNIDADSSLNLRQTPSLSAEVLRRLYRDQQLIVMDVSADGWAHVRTDVIEGYVRAEYLQAAEESADGAKQGK